MFLPIFPRSHGVAAWRRPTPPTTEESDADTDSIQLTGRTGADGADRRGSATVKRDDPHSFMISSHGDWTRIHLGAFEAAYGREPYFPHFFPGIAEIIEAYPPKLEDLNRRLITTMLRLAGYDREKEGLLSLRDENPERFRAIGDRLMAGVNPQHSMIEALFRYGKEILFLISQDFSFPDSHDKC